MKRSDSNVGHGASCRHLPEDVQHERAAVQLYRADVKVGSKVVRMLPGHYNSEAALDVRLFGIDGCPKRRNPKLRLNAENLRSSRDSHRHEARLRQQRVFVD